MQVLQQARRWWLPRQAQAACTGRKCSRVVWMSNKSFPASSTQRLINSKAEGRRMHKEAVDKKGTFEDATAVLVTDSHRRCSPWHNLEPLLRGKRGASHTGHTGATKMTSRLALAPTVPEGGSISGLMVSESTSDICKHRTDAPRALEMVCAAFVAAQAWFMSRVWAQVCVKRDDELGPQGRTVPPRTSSKPCRGAISATSPRVPRLSCYGPPAAPAEAQSLYLHSVVAMAMDDDGQFDGMTEDDLMDDAEVDTMVREAVSSVVADNAFSHNKIDAWSNNIVEGCLKRLAALNKPFKYIATCNLTQKAGAGLHGAHCTRWNEKTDGKLTVQVDHATMIILTVAWALGAFHAARLVAMHNPCLSIDWMFQQRCCPAPHAHVASSA
eukprot:364013-Chlamydomonas_euryale.AAC.2